jgi:hypothetical protein
MENDRAILVSALEPALRTYRQKIPRPTLMSSPDRTVLEPISAAIRGCGTFQAVAGQVLYTGGAGSILDAPLLATQLFQQAEWSNDTEGAVDWLLRVLTTRRASALFKAAVWGVSLDHEVALSGSCRLMPFEVMPDSYMKGRITERAKPCYDGSVWISHSYFDTPRAAFVKEVPQFPYIGADGACFNTIAQLQQEARDLWVIIESVSIGHPLAIGCWFEYADRGLDLAEWQNAIAWILPEIHPRIMSCTPASAARIQDDLRRYAALPTGLQFDLLRSMNRFTLSHCRHQIVDRILDLTLAFEIAVSGDSEQSAPPGWKVSVRSAQLIGGLLKTRRSNRQKINGLYRLRNKATHGSRLQGRDAIKERIAIEECSELYRELLRSFFILGAEPEWNSLELEPRTGIG